MILVRRRSSGRSAAQEQFDLLEEPLGGWLMLKEQVVLALERDKMGAGNASRQLAAGLDRNHKITAHMHHKSRRRHPGEQIADVEIAHDVVIASSALRGGGFALQLVEEVRLLVRSSGDE